MKTSNLCSRFLYILPSLRAKVQVSGDHRTDDGLPGSGNGSSQGLLEEVLVIAVRGEEEEEEEETLNSGFISMVLWGFYLFMSMRGGQVLLNAWHSSMGGGYIVPRLRLSEHTRGAYFLCGGN